MKKILLVISLIFGIMIPEMVSAATFRVDSNLDDIIVKEKNGNKIYKQVEMIKRDDNKYAYSLESGKKVRNNNLSMSSSYFKIDDKTADKIKLISYYGYMYADHKDMKWYAITQLMIWREVDKESSYYFENKDYSSEISTIEKLVFEHYIRPSFADKKIFTGNDIPLEVDDDNKILANYKIINNSGLSINLKNNKFILKEKIDRDYSVLMGKIPNIYSSQPSFYIDDAGSDILSPGDFKSIYFSVSLRALKGNINISLIDKDSEDCDGEFNNIFFSLFDKNNDLIARDSTKDGKVVLKDILYGEYYLRQDNSGYSYNFSNELIPIKIGSSSIDITIYNERKKGKARITNSTVGVEFNIIDKDNEVVSSFITDGSNYYEIELPYGIYHIEQVSNIDYATDKYEIDINSDLVDVTLETINLTEEIDVPDAYVHQVNYLGLIYSLFIITGLGIYEKN